MMSGRGRLLAAARGEPVDATPVWFMRQAGGQLPRYLALRERHDVLAIARSPELCAEVSLGAAEHLGTDGAVLFADIMLLVEAMGVKVRLTDAGPAIESPLRDRADVEALRPVDPRTDLGFVLEAIGRVRAGLDGRAAVIGIAGGPFTLASYLLEGGPSRDQLGARVLMHREPSTWFALMDRIATATIDYGRAQAEAGADVIQLFDTWASSLTPDEYDTFVAPATRRILAALPVPAIHSVARCEALLASMAACGATVIAVDSRQSMATARRRLGGGRTVQGNLDPAMLLVGSAAARAAADAVLAAAGPRGHIFGTGEAQPRTTDPEVLRDLVKHVHDRSAVH